MRRPDRTERLLVCRNGSGWTELRADDLNGRFKSAIKRVESPVMKRVAEELGNAPAVTRVRTWIRGSSRGTNPV